MAEEWGSDAPLPPYAVTSDMYEVGVDTLVQRELEILNSEVQKQKQLPRVEEDIELKVQSIESFIATEDAWDKNLSEVEAKVEVLRPPSDKYKTEKADIRKLNETQLKVYEDQLDTIQKKEAKRVEDQRVEPKRIEARNEHRVNEPKKAEVK
jgi:hypothetical protein